MAYQHIDKMRTVYPDPHDLHRAAINRKLVAAGVGNEFFNVVKQSIDHTPIELVPPVPVGDIVFNGQGRQKHYSFSVPMDRREEGKLIWG